MLQPDVPHACLPLWLRKLLRNIHRWHSTTFLDNASVKVTIHVYIYISRHTPFYFSLHFLILEFDKYFSKFPLLCNVTDVWIKKATNVVECTEHNASHVSL
ncbi:hypothetical protein ACS0PU_008392 [Formica fusca]